VFQNMMVFRRALPDDAETIPVPPVVVEEEVAHEEPVQEIEPEQTEDVATHEDTAEPELEELSSGRRLNLNSESM